MKRRLFLTLIATLALAGPMVGDGLAFARDGGNGRGRAERRSEVRRDFGGDRGGRWRGEDRRQETRDRGDRGLGRRDYGPPAAYRGPQEYGPPRSVRRGGYMPPAFEGRGLADYSRYRLRTPPRGYAWYRVGGGYALVDEYSGQVFDMVPD